MCFSRKSKIQDQKIVLHFFDIPGRVEETRLAFVLGNIPFEDHRISFDEWPKLKQSGKITTGQLPVLEINGKKYNQSGSIARYAANIANLYPKDPEQILQTEQALTTIYEVRNKIISTLFKPEDEARKLQQELSKEFLPLWLARLEDMLRDNGSNGHFAGNSIGISDLAMFQIAEWVRTRGFLDHLDEGIINNYPLIQKCVNIVLSNPLIKEYYSKRS